MAAGAGPGTETKVSADLADRLHAALARFVSKKGFYLAPGIPTSKLAAARIAASLPETEDVLALIDRTERGGPENSIIFGRNGVYYHDEGQIGGWTYQEFLQREFVRTENYLEWDDGTRLYATGRLSLKTTFKILYAVYREVLSVESENDWEWQEEYRRLRERLRNRQWVRVTLDVTPPKVDVGSDVVGTLAAATAGAFAFAALGDPNPSGSGVTYGSALTVPELPVRAPDSCVICGMRPTVCKLETTKTVTVLFGICRFCLLHLQEIDDGGVRIVGYKKGHKPAKPPEGHAPCQRRPWQLTLELINDKVAAEIVRLNQAAHAYIIPTGNRATSPPAGFVTPDRKWRWDGRLWRPVSPDGRWWWNGARWQPM